ncbi:PLPL1 protein, partial [Halcyon senegalensis]|nr:PLPL1 protein [Halcyon senegalensis]
PFSILLRGCSFSILYQAGVVAALQHLSPNLLKSASKVYGASSGAILGAAALCECDIGKGRWRLSLLNLLGNSRWFHLVGKNGTKSLRNHLNKHLPMNAHQLVSGKLHVIITRVRDCRSVTISEFTSKEDLIQAILCSCYVPLWLGIFPPVYRGVRYIDGEIGMWRADFTSRTMITISAFAGEYDICPRDGSAAFFTFQLSDCILQISKRNLCRLMRIV